MGSINNAFGSIVPSQQQQLLNTNFLSFDSATGGGTFAQQYLPEIYENEIERYGNRTLSGFLKMVGAEMPMSSDQVIWSEQNRLHIAYAGVDVVDASANTLSIDVSPADVSNVISVDSTIVIINEQSGAEVKAVVTASDVSNGNLTVAPYTVANLATGSLFADTSTAKIFVYGSEYAKGSTTPNIVSVEPELTQFSNSPIIIRSKYSVSGSDTAQIGWVNVATEEGTDGYLWYLKAESETRLRFEDYLEMSVVEGEKAAAGSGALTNGNKGTEGLFAAIEENMLFLNRSVSLGFDDMLASLSAGANGGTAYGLFDNSEDMALNLGFTGFRRGSYDFYKTDWKYLNDASTRGALATAAASIEGALIPAGTSTVYDQILGTNIRRPFLHVRYRASQADDRRMKTWLTGSVGGAFTSDLDAMEVNFLSERCLCVQAANNFVLFKAA